MKPYLLLAVLPLALTSCGTPANPELSAATVTGAPPTSRATVSAQYPTWDPDAAPPSYHTGRRPTTASY